MKKREKNHGLDSIVEEICEVKLPTQTYKKGRALFGIVLLVLGITILHMLNSRSTAEDATMVGGSNIKLISSPVAVATVQRGKIEIPTKMVKANPFLPYRDIEGGNVAEASYKLIEPPETIEANSEAARLMRVVVSGILYDKYSPSAILNIEGSDYLVKKGDTVNNYKVLEIAKDSVSVKLGENTYQAGIGEILTEGTINYNNVSNLDNKFGGLNNGLQ